MSRRGAKLPKRPPSTIFMAVENWPVEDRILWQMARLKGSLLKDDGRAAGWRPDTIAKNELDYSRYLGWLARVHPEELALPATARVTRDRIKAYGEELHRSLAPLSVSSHLLGLGFMMGALSNGSDFSWITCAAQRLERRSVPVRNNRPRLRSPHELVELGFRLMRDAEEGKGVGGWPPAVTYRNGLIIALLAYRPIRLANLKGIHIGQQLRKSGDRFELHFTADETKQHRLMELHLPATLSAPLTRYMAVHRPVLLARGTFSGTAGNALWVAADGGALSKAGIRRAVLLQTEKAFGKSLGPHLFRSCAATMIAIDDPAHAQDIAAILGHSTMATSERHYNQAQTIDAGRQYHTALRSRRLGLRSKRGRETAPC